MILSLRQRLGQNYVFVVVAVVFLALMVSAGLRTTPGVLILPLEAAFGWDRASISLAAAIGIFLYGLIGPFGAALMLRFGIRGTVLCALALMAASSAASALMRSRWELVLCWGVLSGLSTGCVAVVLGATIGAEVDRILMPHGKCVGVVGVGNVFAGVIFEIVNGDRLRETAGVALPSTKIAEDHVVGDLRPIGRI